MITLLLILLAVATAAKLVIFPRSSAKTRKADRYFTIAGAVGVGLYLLSVAFPFYVCAGKGSNCGGPGYGDVFMIPFAFSPIALGAAFIVAFGVKRLLKPSLRLLVLILMIAVSVFFALDKSMFVIGFAALPVLPPLLLVLSLDAIAILLSWFREGTFTTDRGDV